MKTHPMLFSGSMVRALLEGRKTQTRRVVSKNNSVLGSGQWPEDGLDRAFPQIDGSKLMLPGSELETYHRLYPRKEVGDLLWVKETWRTYASIDGCKPSNIQRGAGIEYLAGGSSVRDRPTLHGMGKTRVSIHMPRWASRLTLRVTDVRVERLEDISEADAAAEGVETWAAGACGDPDALTAVGKFELLWSSINGRENWDSNPWVWAISFEVIKANVDQVQP